MKNKSLIVTVSILAVIICLILAALLFYPVAPDSLVIISFTIGVVTGVCIAALIRNLTYIIRNKKAGLKNP
jgi:multisubunit Na+/H+ antiporter MnhE subunit